MTVHVAAAEHQDSSSGDRWVYTRKAKVGWWWWWGEQASTQGAHRSQARQNSQITNKNGKKIFQTSEVRSGFARAWLWGEYA